MIRSSVLMCLDNATGITLNSLFHARLLAKFDSFFIHHACKRLDFILKTIVKAVLL